MSNCRHCEIIKKSAPNYKARRANLDLDSNFPRCAWHWQFICDRCGKSVSYNGVAWCDKANEFFCILCAPQHQKKKRKFWAWDYYYEVWCWKCSSYHPALDWLEFKGKHPWQKDQLMLKLLRGLSPKKDFKSPIWIKWAPAE